jgi:bile acid:Na+ symporter, BASS family
MQSLLSACVFLMMICIGLNFSWPQWRSLLRSPRPIYVGLAAQNVVTPGIAFAVAWYFRETPELAQAIILIVASPGGPVANAITHYAGARIDLSLSLTAINGLLCLFTAPLIVDCGFLLISGRESGLQLPLAQTMQHLLVIIVLPIVIGGSLNHFAPDFARRLSILTRYGTMALLIGTLFTFFLLNLEKIHLNFTPAITALLLLSTLMLAFGTIFSRACGLRNDMSFAVASEVSIHNVPLALLMAESLLQRPTFSGLIVMYAPVIFLLALIYAWIYRSQRGKATAGDHGSNGRMSVLGREHQFIE